MPRRLLADELIVVFKNCLTSGTVTKVAFVSFVHRLRVLQFGDGELRECEDQMTLA